MEGFKREAYPKIELHRPALRKPLLFPEDDNIIAIASDEPLADIPQQIPSLDLNDIEAIAEFIRNNILHTPPIRRHAESA